MMKKGLVGLFVLFGLLLSSVMPDNASAAVNWEGMELKKGQIGKVIVIKQTTLYKLNGTSKKPVRTLKPGEVYRIYTFLPGKLGLGAGHFVDRDTNIKYKTPSKVKLQALGVKITKNMYEGTIEYPQVNGLISKSAQDQINEAIKKHVRNSYHSLISLENEEIDHRQDYYDEHGYPVPEDEDYMYNYNYQMSYAVKYNENNLLSILIYDYMYTGGAHGMETVESYNFDVLNGSQVNLGSVAKSSTGLAKIKKYAITDLTNRANRGESFFPEEFSSIVLNNERPFFYTGNGIVIKFFEYEISPYSSGMPEVKIPYSAFR